MFTRRATLVIEIVTKDYRCGSKLTELLARVAIIGIPKEKKVWRPMCCRSGYDLPKDNHFIAGEEKEASE